MIIIAIDFDGTCVTHDYPRVGRDIGAISVLKKLVENGHQLILYTMRSDFKGRHYLTDAVNWFKDNNIPLYGINNNSSQLHWTTSPKVLADLYIDDAALGCPLLYSLTDGPYVDWIEVEKILKSKALL